MGFRLREHLHWCVCGERVIFLDVAADRYFCLSFKSAAAFRALAEGRASTGDRESLCGLIKRGILLPSAEQESLGAIAPVPPPLQAYEGHQERPSPADRVRRIACEARAAWQLRRRSLLELTEGIRTRAGAASPPFAEARLGRLVSSFAAPGLLSPSAGRCLVRAVAFQAACAQSGIGTQIVFGVRVNPFTAHSWVQLDDAVLIGDFEQARVFTPIAAFG